MQLPSDSFPGPGAGLAAGSAAALDVLTCVRSLFVASQLVRERLRDTGARARLGRLGARCAGALAALEGALSGMEPPRDGLRVPHGLRSVIDVGGVGADLCLLLELDVLAARLQARIDDLLGLLAHGAPPALRDTLCTLSELVREIRAEYELYAA